MLSFFSGSGGTHGPDLPSPFRRKFLFLLCEDMLNMVLSEDKEVIMTGDLNCNYKKKADNKTLKEIIRMNGSEQVIKESTRVTQREDRKRILMLTLKQADVRL